MDFFGSENVLLQDCYVQRYSVKVYLDADIQPIEASGIIPVLGAPLVRDRRSKRFTRHYPFHNVFGNGRPEKTERLSPNEMEPAST